MEQQKMNLTHMWQHYGIRTFRMESGASLFPAMGESGEW